MPALVSSPDDIRLTPNSSRWQGGLTIQERTQLADPRTRAEAELKAMDPAKYFGTQFYKQASNFFELLRGPQ